MGDKSETMCCSVGYTEGTRKGINAMQNVKISQRTKTSVICRALFKYCIWKI